MKLETVTGLYKDIQQVEGGESVKYYALFAGVVDNKAVMAGDGGTFNMDASAIKGYAPGEKIYFDEEGHQLEKGPQPKASGEKRRHAGSAYDPQRGQAMPD